MDDNPLKKEANEYMGYLLNSNREAAYDLIVRTLKTKALKDIYLNIIQVSQYEIGRLWQKGDVSVAQEHYCTASTQLIMAKMYPLVFTTPHASTKILACCIGNELHELGIRMIADLLEVDGYDTLYLGANTPLEAIRSTVLGRDIDMVIISTTMLRNVQYVKELIAKLKEEAIKVKILVGGHPFNQDDNLWKEVGADAHSFDAAEALEIVKRMSYE
jgi:methanogenic corrinoid protein MtbC1